MATGTACHDNGSIRLLRCNFSSLSDTKDRKFYKVNEIACLSLIYCVVPKAQYIKY